MLSALLIGGAGQLTGMGKGVSTLVGSNASCKTAHFPCIVLIPLMYDNPSLPLGLYCDFIALCMLMRLVALNLSSQYFHWACSMAFLHLLDDFLYRALASALFDFLIAYFLLRASSR